MPLLSGYIFSSSNRIEILLVFPENESHQQKMTYFLAGSVVLAQQSELRKVIILSFIGEPRVIGLRSDIRRRPQDLDVHFLHGFRFLARNGKIQFRFVEKTGFRCLLIHSDHCPFEEAHQQETSQPDLTNLLQLVGDECLRFSNVENCWPG
jgi:hypothetical protein